MIVGEHIEQELYKEIYDIAYAALIKHAPRPQFIIYSKSEDRSRAELIEFIENFKKEIRC